MQSVHTLNLECVHAARALPSIAGLARPCRRPGSTVSQPVVGGVVAVSQACLYGHAAVSLRARCRVATRMLPCRYAHAAVSLRARCRVAPALGNDTSLYRNKLPVVCLVARAPDRIAGRVTARYCRVATLYRSPTTPCCGFIQPYRGASPALPPSLVSLAYHDTLHCIVTQI